jgi:hypothetical protein
MIGPLTTLSGTQSKLRRLWQAAGFLLAACWVATSSFAADERPVRAHIGYGAEHPLAQSGWRAFLNRLSQERAAPKLALFLNGPPPDDPAAIENLGRGDYAFGAAALPAFTNDFPYTALLSEQGLAGGADELAAAAAATELLAIDCIGCQRAFAAKRIVFLGGYSAARYVLLSRSRANSPMAFRGLAALTPGSAWDRLIGSLGGVVREEEGDAGDLFAKGAIGAAITTPMELSDPDVWAHARHALIAPLGAYRGGGAFLASAGYWGRMTAKGRRAVMNATADGIVGVVWGFQNMADAAMRAAAARGLTVDAPTPELAEAMRIAIAADNRRVAETAGERFGITDAAAFLDRFLLLYDKFAVLLANVRDPASASQVLRQEIFDRIDVNRYGME